MLEYGASTVSDPKGTLAPYLHQQGGKIGSPVEQLVVQPGATQVKHTEQLYNSSLNSSFVDSEEDWTTVVRNRKKGHTRRGTQIQPPADCICIEPSLVHQNLDTWCGYFRAFASIGLAEGSGRIYSHWYQG